MISTLLETGMFSAIAVVLIVCSSFFKKPKSWKPILLFLLVSAIDTLLLSYGSFFPNLQIPNTHFNWIGKFLSISFALSIIVLSKSLSFRDCGVTFQQRKGSIRAAIITSIIVLIAVIILDWSTSTKETIRLENHLFQLTMPGFSEELTFRGIYLFLLNKAFGKDWVVGGARIGWAAIIMSLLFGIGHGIALSPDLTFQFSMEGIVITGVIGFILVWLKEKTESLVFPILLHNLINETGNIVSVFLFGN